MTDVELVYPRIDDARSTVRAEIEVIEAETHAFETLLARLDRLAPEGSSGTAGGGNVIAVTANRGVEPAAVEEAYRETVLAMDHYERDYGEPLAENVGLELGQAVRELLDSGGPIHPVQFGVVETAAEQALEERRRFRRLLREELESLRSIADGLADVERRLHELGRGADQDERRPATDERMRGLEELAEACQTLSADRQRTLHRRSNARISGIGDRSLVEFLYGDRDHRFPALVEVVDVASRIDAAGVGVPAIDATLR